MNLVIQNKMFHRINLYFVQCRKIKPKDQTIRNLLCCYLSLAVKQYPSEASFNTFLAKLYDLSYNVSVSTVGSYSLITYAMKAVDPKYVDDSSYNIKTLVDSFNKCLEPVTKKDNFDLQLFRKAVEIYRSNLLYLSEQDGKVATNLAIHEFFKGTVRDFLVDGDLETLEKITCKKLYNYYLDTLNDEKISISIGDIKNEIKEDKQQTITLKEDYFFSKRIRHESYISVPANTEQAYIQVIYDNKIFTNDPLFYSITILNYAFGASANSILFRLVREKYGLCYSISSVHMGASGIILVSTVVAKNKVQRTISAIDEAFGKLLEYVNIDEAKAYFISICKGKADYLDTYVTNAFYPKYFANYISDDQEIELIKQVTKESIAKAYKKLKKSLVYVYGDQNE